MKHGDDPSAARAGPVRIIRARPRLTESEPGLRDPPDDLFPPALDVDDVPRAQPHPSCPHPTLTTGSRNDAASMIPLEELPTIAEHRAIRLSSPACEFSTSQASPPLRRTRGFCGRASPARVGVGKGEHCRAYGLLERGQQLFDLALGGFVFQRDRVVGDEERGGIHPDAPGSLDLRGGHRLEAADLVQARGSRDRDAPRLLSQLPDASRGVLVRDEMQVGQAWSGSGASRRGAPRAISRRGCEPPGP